MDEKSPQKNEEEVQWGGWRKKKTQAGPDINSRERLGNIPLFDCGKRVGGFRGMG